MENIWCDWIAQKMTVVNPQPVPYLGSDDTNERALAKWYKKTRDKYRRGTLSAEEVERIGALPGWTWGKKKDFEFARRSERWVFFYRTHGRCPKASATDEEEKVLARWALRQQRLRAAGKLSEEHTTALKNMQGWVWKAPTTTVSFEQRVHEWTEHVNHTGRAPVEGDLSKWRTRLLREYAQGKLSEDKIWQLQNLPEWSWEEEKAHIQQGRKWSAWVRTNEGTFPSYQATTNPVEHRLGNWAYQMKAACHAGQVPEDLYNDLIKLPFWRNYLATPLEEGI